MHRLSVYSPTDVKLFLTGVLWRTVIWRDDRFDFDVTDEDDVDVYARAHIYVSLCKRKNRNCNFNDFSKLVGDTLYSLNYCLNLQEQSVGPKEKP